MSQKQVESLTMGSDVLGDVEPAQIRHHLYDGNAFLLLAAAQGRLDVVIDLTTKQNCDPNCEDPGNSTPLHHAATAGHLDVVKYLIEEQHCDPTTKNILNWTPLDVAFSSGRIHVAQYLLSTDKVKPRINVTLPHYALNPRHRHIQKLLRLFPQYKKEFPVHTYTKLILTGCSGAGKTTISQLILFLARKVGLLSALSSGRVNDVECLSAGIMPLHVKSKVKNIGNMVMYDFSGRQEYYSSHAAVLEHIMRNSAVIFACIVDLSQCMDKISESIHYWMSFMENACSSAQGSSHVIVVGSHADLVKSSQELKEKSSLVEGIAENTAKQLIYKGFVSMDCRESKTEEAHYFCSLLSTSQQAILSSQPSMSLYCHVLYGFLCKTLGRTICTLQELTTALTSEKYISFDPSSLAESLTSLSEKGLILFLPNQENPESSLIVVEKEAFLKKIVGTLFASENFKQFASNTGIIPTATLEELFPQHSSEVLVGSLKSMEFCHEIALQDIESKSTSPSSSKTNHLFFPCFIDAQQPGNLLSPAFGWCLGINEPHQYFSNRFLHVLLLKLANKFLLASKSSSSLRYFEKECNIWQKGISWKSSSGVSTIVEILDRNRWVIVLVSEKSKEAAEIYSSVIRMILDLQQQLCCAINTCECLMSPSLLKCYPFDSLPATDLFDLPALARSMLFRQDFSLNKIATDETLLCEPYYLLQPYSVCQLFNQSMASQPVPDSLFQEVLRYCQQKPQNHKELRECVNKYSIFAGRNPLEVAELNEKDIINNTTAGAATKLPTAAAGVCGDLLRALTFNDLCDVLEAVDGLDDWISLGLNLGLSYPTLQKVSEKQQGNISQCKLKMMVAWLQGQDNVMQHGVPSWSVLKAALQRMGENKIADKINTTKTDKETQ